MEKLQIMKVIASGLAITNIPPIVLKIPNINSNVKINAASIFNTYLIIAYSPATIKPMPINTPLTLVLNSGLITKNIILHME